MSRGHAQAVHMGRPKKADVRCEEDVKILSQSFFFRRTLRLGALGKKYDFEAVGKRNCTRTMISAKDYKITKGIIIATPLGAATPMRFTTRSCKTQ